MTLFYEANAVTYLFIRAIAGINRIWYVCKTVQVTELFNTPATVLC